MQCDAIAARDVGMDGIWYDSVRFVIRERRVQEKRSSLNRVRYVIRRQQRVSQSAIYNIATEVKERV
jgi:hypothetical protein